MIASLWSVPDDSAAFLMMRFYELWKPGSDSGMSAAEALREAQRWLRDSSGRAIDEYRKRQAPGLTEWTKGDPDDRPYADPVYWAAFYLTGV